ncbi:protein-methionine sulfoxide oxidase MICAL2 [Platysternon megacephalum]|uniref:Protein-methionine sulfoxide oxidase MICAL2 n=1 Tax=Platysternon megacephalum TaxID=55544 RepID=A0A4D9DZ99_9SAUR|nr:protein-methionine sulfoxide oxidase MICAL2 [Platysternon megacephalum]
MSLKKIDFHQLPYREMERLRQFRRDLIKAIPIGLLSLPPFANYLIFLLMYLFPRQLLIRHFWTPKQQFEFLNIYHGMRREVYPEIIDGLEQVTRFVADQQLRDQMQELCTKVQSGSHPEVAKLLAVRSLFAGHPLGLQRLRIWQVKALSRVLFLTPHLPIILLRYRLRSHMLELQHLDRAMLKLGVSELSEEEVKMACYIRGLNSTHLNPSECQKWLKQWAQLSCELKGKTGRAQPAGLPLAGSSSCVRCRSRRADLRQCTQDRENQSCSSMSHRLIHFKTNGDSGLSEWQPYRCPQ